MSFTVEKLWMHKDLKCAVVMTDMGHRCGYVSVTNNHCLHGINYGEDTYKLYAYVESLQNRSVEKDKISLISLFCGFQHYSPDIIFEVHGGLTYSNNNDYPISHFNLWWFGYDCAHASDGKDLSVVPDYVKELEERFPTNGIVRSLSYCIDECNNLADQLITADNTYKFRKDLLTLKFK